MNKISKITICLNNICDRECEYCYRNSVDKSTYNKPFEFNYWKELVKYLAYTKDIELDTEVGVCFTGGEPFLSHYTMLEGISSLRTLEIIKDVKMKFGCITNLCDCTTLLDFIRRGYLYKEGVSISWDYYGTRYEEFDIGLLRSTSNLYFNGDYKDLYIKMSVTDKSIPFLYKGFRLLRDYGFTNLGYYFVNGTDDYKNEEIREEFREQLIKIKNDKDNIYLGNYIDSRIEDRPYCNKLGSLLYIDTAGGIWPCAFYSDDTNVHGIEDIDKYKLGDIFNGFKKDYTELKERPNSKWTERFCHACSNECRDRIKKMKQIELNVFNK